MSKGTKISPAEIDFWLDMDRYSTFIDNSNPTLTFNIDMIRLASIRSAVSNFVRILTRTNIPVLFSDTSETFNTGKNIYISSKITNKQEFDKVVGLALHEGAHTLKTDFDLAINMWANFPPTLLKLSDSKNIRRKTFERFMFNMWNIIEDRYIDTYVFNAAPGYRGYYVALYDLTLNSPVVEEYLNGDLFRYPSLKSYEFRIMNLTNECTDLLSLPCLEDIAKEIDLSNIDRLEVTKDRINTAFKVTEIVLNCIDKQNSIVISLGSGSPGQSSSKNSGLADPNDYFEFEDKDKNELTGSNSSGNKNEDDETENEEDVDVGKKMINEISDIMNGKNPSPEILDENTDAVEKISNDNVDKDVQKEVDNIMQDQHKMLIGDVTKEKMTDYQKALLDLVEKHGITLVRVDCPTLLSGNNSSLKVDCIVVEKMTSDLVFSGADIFPLCGAMKMGTTVPTPPEEVSKAVKTGIVLGTKLGKKLQIRNEEHSIKIIRKRHGKINRRQLHEAAFDSENLFYNVFIEKHNNASLHISVDASSSMEGKKWEKTMIAVVAICKAVSMIDNIHVTVSFRSTQISGGTHLPYIILAYDSKKDDFSKVKYLFPYLTPSGFTPEGLAFSAIMNLFDGITPDEEDRYFLNLSDGEPCYILNSKETDLEINYMDEIGTSHTKSQVDKIRNHDIQILSYFIEDENYMVDDKLKDDFKKMYGRNAKFIRVDDIVDLAKTLNDLFLQKS